MHPNNDSNSDSDTDRSAAREHLSAPKQSTEGKKASKPVWQSVDKNPEAFFQFLRAKHSGASAGTLRPDGIDVALPVSSHLGTYYPGEEVFSSDSIYRQELRGRRLLANRDRRAHRNRVRPIRPARGQHPWCGTNYVSSLQNAHDRNQFHQHSNMSSMQSQVRPQVDTYLDLTIGDMIRDMEAETSRFQWEGEPPRPARPNLELLTRAPLEAEYWGVDDEWDYCAYMPPDLLGIGSYDIAYPREEIYDASDHEIADLHHLIREDRWFPRDGLGLAQHRSWYGAFLAVDIQKEGWLKTLVPKAGVCEDFSRAAFMTRLYEYMVMIEALPKSERNKLFNLNVVLWDQLQKFKDKNKWDSAIQDGQLITRYRELQSSMTAGMIDAEHAYKAMRTIRSTVAAAKEVIDNKCTEDAFKAVRDDVDQRIAILKRNANSSGAIGTASRGQDHEMDNRGDCKGDELVDELEHDAEPGRNETTTKKSPRKSAKIGNAKVVKSRAKKRIRDLEA